MSSQVSQAVKILRSGGLVAIPTETVYGLAALAENELAVRRIFAVKRRPSTHPLIVHLADAEAAVLWASELPVTFHALAKAFWPGPLTMVVRRSERATDAVTGGQDTVALRVPDHPLTLQLLRQLNGGVAAPSANRFGHVSPTTAEHVRQELGDEVDLILDGGACSVGVESTIVDLTNPEPRLLRPGGVSREELVRVLGRPVALGPASESTRAPGLLPSHYAPRAGVLVVPQKQLAEEAKARSQEGKRVAVMAPTSVPLPKSIHLAEMPADPDGFARMLYATMRKLDDEGFELLITSFPDEQGLGLAIRDRLSRAAAPRSD